MPTQACLSPRSGVRRRKDSSERAVWPSGRPLRPARIRPNPPNPGQMARFPSKTALQSAVEAVRRPSPLPPPLRKTGPRPSQQHTAKGPFTRRRPPPTPKLQTRNPTPAPLWTSALLQGDRNPPESVIGLPERVIGIVGMRTTEGRKWVCWKSSGPTSRPTGGAGMESGSSVRTCPQPTSNQGSAGVVPGRRGHLRPLPCCEPAQTRRSRRCAAPNRRGVRS